MLNAGGSVGIKINHYMFTNALKSIVFSFDCYLLLVIIWTFKNMFQERK